MPPLAPHAEKGCSGGSGCARQRRGAAAAAGGFQRRSASFHGREAEQRVSPKERPKTQPDLLVGVRGASFRRSVSPDGGGGGDGRRTPSKVLVSVSVQSSMWPLNVMAAAEWSVADLVAAAVGQYVKEGRRPSLPSADPAAYGLHFSQFSMESLDPSEKVMQLGSRSFFLCPKSSSVLGHAASSASVGAGSLITEASGKAAKAPVAPPVWLSNMQFWPMM